MSDIINIHYLPKEIIAIITSYLDPNSTMNLKFCCKVLNDLVIPVPRTIILYNFTSNEYLLIDMIKLHITLFNYIKNTITNRWLSRDRAVVMKYNKNMENYLNIKKLANRAYV